MKNVSRSSSGRLNTAEHRISFLDDKSVEIAQMKQKQKEWIEVLPMQDIFWTNVSWALRKERETPGTSSFQVNRSWQAECISFFLNRRWWTSGKTVFSLQRWALRCRYNVQCFTYSSLLLSSFYKLLSLFYRKKIIYPKDHTGCLTLKLHSYHQMQPTLWTQWRNEAGWS